MNRFAIRLAALLLGLMAVSSCSDDRYLMSGEFGDGEADIAVTASFKSYDAALAESRADGNILDGIDNLTVLVYDSKGETLLREESYKKGDEGFDYTGNTNRPADGDKYPEGDDQYVPTDKVTFSLPSLPYGRYKIYVVANAELPAGEYDTEADLKEVKYKWDSENIGNNKQMFGWFATDNHSDLNAWELNAPTVVINKPRIEINAWLVRLASKVTVAYDATDLNEGVTIYLKDVQIKDIPMDCALGITNTPTETSQLIADGGIIKYYTSEEAPEESAYNDSYPARLVKNSKYGYGMDEANYHSHSADALFFYENCQGEGKDKRQDAVDNSTTAQTPGDKFNPGSGDPDGEIDFPNGNDQAANSGYKDEKRCGTYIEVTAYYSNDGSKGEKGQGKIVYRFMLGKNVTTDYNATRNYHYKLTLKFKGNANDVDWHIEYTPDPKITLPNPYFISYLYDKSAVIPVEIEGVLHPDSMLRARIVENGWWPGSYDTEKNVFTTVDENLEQYYGPSNKNYADTQHPWNGFLSLRDTGHTIDISPGTSAADANDANEKYWKNPERMRGYREYNTSDGTYNEDGAGEYTVSTNPESKAKVFNIPYYTRAKNLVKASGYTGNNPYVSYQRRALVEFKATIKSPIQGKYVDYLDTVEIIQVRRIVNPKGIWRAYNEDDKFDVHLMRLETEYTTNPWGSGNKFESFTSIGPWSAEVMVEGAYRGGVHTNESWIKLDDKLNAKINGETGTEIKFKYQPDGKLLDSEKDDVRYGVIKIRYHNYTCEHLIFVRQGYAPIPVASNADATKWYSFNLQTEEEMATSPCDEGSLFKRFRTDIPIRPENNIKYPFQQSIVNQSLDVNYKPYGKSADNPGVIWTKKWDEWYTPLDEQSFKTMKNRLTGEEMKVASVNDYLELYNDDDVQYGFGVLYDGTATGVAERVEDAYSYYGKYISNGTSGVANAVQDKNYKAGRGMRGCFVYNESTGAQIFLPIGAAGYGRRKQNAIYPGTFHAGDLIYANRNGFMAQNDTDIPWCRPLLWDLYRRPGAIYWCNELQKGELLGNSQAKDCLAWDFNYITFDFFPISVDNVTTYKGGNFVEIMKEIEKDKFEGTGETATDALRIRCVVPETSKPVTNGTDKTE